MERSTPRPAAVKTSMEEVGSQWRGVARSSVQSKFTLLDVFWRPFHNIIPFLRIPQKKSPTISNTLTFGTEHVFVEDAWVS